MPRDERVPLREYPQILWRGALPLSLPIVLLTGIYTGAFTPTEAAAVAALHALLLAGVVYRALTWRTLYGVLLDSTRSSAVITLIIAGAFMLNYAFTVRRRAAGAGAVGRLARTCPSCSSCCWSTRCSWCSAASSTCR